MGRLVQIEVENFKSYRGHQVIGPFSSFTAVVGPNGAGKSNLMDAISFVLGVRSSHLRSSQLKDLVYRGRTVESRGGRVTDEAGDQSTRRAWVKAVYEDGNGRTVVFQRSIASSGDSEYRINNRTVTLQTYNSTLESQNILVKAKNFLVFQGDVEAVASQSPKDLTRFIEQISGSWDLQHEYTELEKQQDAAAEKSTFAYNKKRAVATEVQSILNQKKELDLYESKIHLRTKLTVQHMQHKLFVAENRISEIKNEMSALHGETITQASTQRSRLDASLQSQQKSQAKAYKAVNRQERQIKLIEQKIESRQPKLAGLGEKVSHLQRRIRQIEENAESAHVEVGRQGAVVGDLDAEYTRVKDAESRFEEQIQGQHVRSAGQVSSEIMAEYNRLSEELRSVAVEDTHHRDVLDRQIQLFAETCRRASDKLDGVQAQREGLVVTEHSLAQQLQQAEADVRAVEQEIQTAKRDAEASKAEHAKLVRLETELNEKLGGVLKDLSQARADQRESAREARLKDTVSALQRIFTGVHGRLAELCKPTQRKYDVAIATVLGRHLDAIVVDNQSTAIECINYMKEQRAGQATFLPLDTLQPPHVSDNLRHTHHGARLATDVIQYDPSIEVAVLHACGNALVCDTMAVAKYVCYERRLDAKAVTVDGSIIHRSGLITGGTSSRGGNSRAQVQRWEAAAVENLRKARDRLTEELHGVARERRKLTKDDVLGSRLVGLQTKHRVSRETVDALARKMQAVATERKHLESQIHECEPVSLQATGELEQAQLERKAVNEKIHAAAQPIFAGFCQELGIESLEVFEKQLLPATEAADERRLQFTTQLSRLNSQREFENQQLDEATAKLDRLTETLESDRQSLAGLHSDMDREQREMTEFVAQIASLRAELAELNSKYGDATENVHAARHSLEQGRKELDAMNKVLAAKTTELERAAAEKAAVLRRCKIEDIPLPLVSGSLQALALEAGIGASMGSQLAESYMSQLSLGDTTQGSTVSLEDADDIVTDFSSLPQQAKSGPPPVVDQKFTDDIARLSAEIDALNPNPHARERLEAARIRLSEIEAEHTATRQEAKDAKAAFQAVRKRRHDLFMRCYNHLSTAIDHAYKALTQSSLFPLGGTAYLALEDPDSPYLAGVKYHAMPPLKRFRDMDQLSGGEKTVAALALLFSLQTFRPAPFFVLDEVDAALDLANVAKLANYLREHARSLVDDSNNADNDSADDGAEATADDTAASPYSLRQRSHSRKNANEMASSASAIPLPAAHDSADFQFIVISLKQTLFERAHSLVGIYRDQAQNSSQVLTMDLEQFPA
ncbi:Structural maintenance of chromosomes protein 1 [Coemansia sp. RSA 1813]|nr:Structural maintenance of chromosomes protein 1 [Coemansia sp. RSA 1646]KAJ1772812.1 Structural maintenance of chromosomes protein 1 [Coemansia sp. RSA 1843]KAJ2088921.1 Structural maintenance of chromosomes protein 1 [Coemansia sp. RSA 986]KAJ2213925.1 Structural maintenance of chromosomes protein 1 [Coemansia sp. RSA 487]KAJ2568766.1 Structural maintenance of chromosomes protein 1 [Coemansia sp. RSA 1813]